MRKVLSGVKIVKHSVVPERLAILGKVIPYLEKYMHHCYTPRYI